MAKPKYQEIVDELIKELSEGRLNQGDRFYSEAEIKDRFAVSSTTAVKVLNLLQEKLGDAYKRARYLCGQRKSSPRGLLDGS